MNLTRLLCSPLVHALGWTLCNSLWQAAAVAAVLAPSLWLLRKSTPQARYAACGLALGLAILLPAGTFCLMPARSESSAISDGPPPAPSVISGPSSQTGIPAATEFAAETLPAGEQRPAVERGPAVQNGPGSLASKPDLPLAASPVVTLPPIEPSPPWQARLARGIEPALPWAVAVWLLGVLGTSVWHVGGWIAVQRLKVLGIQPIAGGIELLMSRMAVRLRLKKRVRLVRSLLVETPLVVGLLRPMILLPSALLTGLTPEQLEAILAHELAHVRRYDYLVNLLQTMVETLLFYHPAAWWISRRMRLERELCCDDVAAGVCGDRIGYAEALAAVEEARAAVPAIALAARGNSGEKDFVRRIGRLLGISDAPAGGVPRSLAGTLAVLTILAVAIYASLLGGPATTAAVTGAESDASAGKLRYEISLRTPQIKAGGALRLEARLINEGDEEVVVPWADCAYDDLYRFVITDEQGRQLAGPTERMAPPVALSQDAMKSVPAHGMLRYEMFLRAAGRERSGLVLPHARQIHAFGKLHGAMDSYVEAKAAQAIKRPVRVDGHPRGPAPQVQRYALGKNGGAHHHRRQGAGQAGPTHPRRGGPGRGSADGFRCA